MFSQTADYALRALLLLARHSASVDGDRYLRADQISGATGMPANYTAKILNTLARQGILTSTRGPTGGFRLAVNPNRITAADVVDLFNMTPRNRHCILGDKPCNPRRPCSAHRRWSAVLNAQRAPLAATTIADLAQPHTQPRNG